MEVIEEEKMSRVNFRSTLRLLIIFTVCFGLGMSISLSSQDAVGCPSDMIHYWKLDETGGSYYYDFYGADATCTSCPVAVAGMIGGAQQFSAATQVNVADDSTFDWDSTDSFSVEFWMKGDSSTCSTGSQVVIG
ncbi:MAG: hypothetical protein AB1390_08605, partial [Nitrospirota bacterium]